MSKQAKLEVTFPVKLANVRARNTDPPFMEHVQDVMTQSGEEIVHCTIVDDCRVVVDSSFPSRDHAINAAKAFRSLSLEHATAYADSFGYRIDGDELILFNNKDDVNSFESKSFAEVMEEQVGSKVSEAFSGFVGI